MREHLALAAPVRIITLTPTPALVGKVWFLDYHQLPSGAKLSLTVQVWR